MQPSEVQSPSDKVQPAGEDSTRSTTLEAESQLSEQDLKRVEKYLSSPVHQVERKPFRPWLMMLGLVGVISALSLLSLLISWLVLE